MVAMVIYQKQNNWLNVYTFTLQRPVLYICTHTVDTSACTTHHIPCEPHIDHYIDNVLIVVPLTMLEDEMTGEG